MSQPVLKLTDTPIATVRDSQIVGTQSTRMGGALYRLRTSDGVDVFLKIGRGFLRIELMREHRNLVALREIVRVPEVIGFHDDGSEAQLAVTQVHGKPLYEVWPRLGDSGYSLLIDVIRTLWAGAGPSALPNAVSEELADIEQLLTGGWIDEAAFSKAAGGLSPATVLGTIRAQVPEHDADVMTHGDLCLPNIMVDDQDRWALIDVGKAGRGDRARDLSSLEVSLKRNVGTAAFDELLRRLEMPRSETLQKKLDLYHAVDLFWYNARLGPVTS